MSEIRRNIITRDWVIMATERAKRPHEFGSFKKVEDISEEEIQDLASILKKLLLKIYYGLGDPDYNYTIRSSPTADRETRYFHWYLSIIPKMSKQAGFEMGTGMYINSSIPEESAEYLRSIVIPE